MKKSCNGCRAFDFGCTLGYQTDASVHATDPYLYTPLEDCPKPKTYNQYLKLRKQRKWK